MITQSTPFTPTQLASLIEAYYDGAALSGSSQWVGIGLSDLNTASLPAAISSSPRQTIKQVSGSFTIPTKFFGVHATAESLPALGSAGAGGVRTRDQGVTWYSACPTGTISAATFTIGTSTVNWAGHGLTAAASGIAFYSLGGTLPTGVSPYVYYYLTNVTTNNFQLSLTPNGVPINMSGTSNGTIYTFAFSRSVLDPLGGKLNVLVAAAIAAGMDVLYDCSEIPTWISKDGTRFNIPLNNNYVNIWIAVLYNMFGTNISYFEVWNEPNTPGYFNGTTTPGGNDLWSYAAWIKAACGANNAALKVVSPSWSTGGAAAMGTWLGSNGGAAQVDIVGFHCYRGAVYLGFSSTEVDAFVASATANAPGKPIWMTECGESTASNALIWRSHLYAAAKGVARYYYYDYDTGTGSQNGGFQNMQITNYSGLAESYRAMISACANKTCAYVNRTGITGGYVGASINGVAYQF